MSHINVAHYANSPLYNLLLQKRRQGKLASAYLFLTPTSRLLSKFSISCLTHLDISRKSGNFVLLCQMKLKFKEKTVRIKIDMLKTELVKITKLLITFLLFFCFFWLWSLGKSQRLWGLSDWLSESVILVFNWINM